ncbi:MAG: hypothetical protein KF704_02460 [Crocinitomicaceae bacterium]|nr:hypothetical protein [Crocinitomicaceae bacterium]
MQTSESLSIRIEKHKVDLNRITEEIKNDFEIYFKEQEFKNGNTEIQIIPIKSKADIDKIYSGIGFYIILTDKSFDDNQCTFNCKNHTAIYRGHSYTTRQRVLSHLLNKIYRASRKSTEPDYKVCLKIEDGVNGININKKPYNKWEWTVVVIKLRGSNKLIREQAEIAFDSVFGKPCKSREI